MNYKEDDDGEFYSYDDYTPKTTDPGPWLFIFVAIYSFSCMLILPCLVVCERRYLQRQLDHEQLNDQSLEEEDSNSETKEEMDNLGDIETQLVEDENHQQIICSSSNLLINNIELCENKDGNANNSGGNGHSPEEVYDSSHVNDDVLSIAQTIDHLRAEDVTNADNTDIPGHLHQEDEEEEFTFCCGPKTILAWHNIRHYYEALADIAHFDIEMKRLLQLCWPMTLAAGIGALFEAISVGIVANYLGTDVLIAYVVTELLIGLTDTFLAGPSDALHTLCAHAIGGENYTLAGQYVQIAAALYLLLGLPTLGVWYFWIGDIVRLMDLERVADMVSNYTKIVVWHYVLSGLFDGYNALLDISGYVTVVAVFDTIYGLTNVVILWLMCVYYEGFNLYLLGVTQLIVSVAFFIMFTFLVVYKGWLSSFAHGMLRTFALSNVPAVTNVFATAIPLSFGSLLEYGEWEALTFFVAYLGDAEVAAWGLLESIWTFSEAATEGLSEAASIRVAYHLGNGNIDMAKLSSFKSLFMGVILSVFITALLFIMGDELPKWLTPDPTLQKMLNDLIPMIGMANVFMVFGMVAWTLIGAQGRYKLATIISLCMTIFITMPLAAISTFYFVYDLKGIVGSIICGYSTTGLCLGYILLTSDWEHISENIQECNRQYESSDSESESDSLGNDDNVALPSFD